MNNHHSCIHNLSNCEVDTVVYFAINSVSEIQTQLTTHFNYVIGWMNGNFPILYLYKTKIVQVGWHQKLAVAENIVMDISNIFSGNVTRFQISWAPFSPHLIQLEG